MNHNYKLLRAVFLMQNPSRNRACNDATMQRIRSLAPVDCIAVQHKGNLLLRKGDPHAVQPYFLAHMDQVHEYEPYMRVLQEGNILSAVDGNGKQCGVGGDDKCGIYLALMMLHVLPNCTAVFVRDEEVGCLGSGEIPLSWFASASFVLQADRNNRTFDVIRETNGMRCASDEFMSAALALPCAIEHGHGENSGSVTDIGELAQRGLGCSMVNISSGYHHPHSHNEVVHLDELSVAMQLAYELSIEHGDRRWPNEPVDLWHSYSYSTKSKTPYYFEDERLSGSEERSYGMALMSRDDLIDELLGYGYDPDLHGLEKMTRQQLIELLDECSPYEEDELPELTLTES